MGVANRILVLDDERALTLIAKAFLEQEGYEVREAHTHVQALEVASVFRPDVFVTGVFNACEENGCETAVEIQVMLPQCRVLILSASGEPVWKDFKERGYDFEFLPKPSKPHAILAKIKALAG